MSDSVVITCDVTGTVTYVFEVSNDERTTRSYRTVATYNADVVKRLSASIPRFLRVRMTGGSGSVDVAMGKAKNSDGRFSEVNAESRHA